MLDQMKIQNLTNIMTCLLSLRSATKAELVQITGLSNSTVSDSINNLLKQELVVSIGMKKSMGGRRATIYRLNPFYGQFIGLDLTKHALEICITDCENKPLWIKTVPLNQKTPIINSLLQELVKCFTQFPKVLGIGIGLDGSIDIAEQVVIHSDDQHWNRVHLKEIIERQFLTYTAIDHRSNGATLEEGLLGNARNHANYLCLFESSQNKLGIVLNNDLCRGTDNMAGKLDSVETFFEQAANYCNLFAPSKVVIRYKTDAFKKNAGNLVEMLGKELTVTAPEEEAGMAKGMALLAQKGWFKSIYFFI